MRDKKKSVKARAKRGEGRAGDSVSPSLSTVRAGRKAGRARARVAAGGGPKSRPTVGVVGAGRLGTALALALARRGYAVEFLVTRGPRGARRAARAAGVGAARALSLSRLGETTRVGLLFVTTPDDAVAETAARLAEVEDWRLAAVPEAEAAGGGSSKGGGKGLKAGGASAVGGRVSRGVVLHTSGALSSEALAPLRERGYAVGSLHPLAAVSGDAAAGAESLGRAFFCVEGDARAVGAARRVVRDLGARSFSVPTGAKALYHAAAVTAAGHLVALFDSASALLARCGLSEAEARRVLLPLSQSALDNLARHDPPRALTGSFARADVETVGRHLAALRAAGDAEALEIYRLLGRRSLRLAAENGADRDPLSEIARLLFDATRPATKKN